jgi:hypothetical protein
VSGGGSHKGTKAQSSFSKCRGMVCLGETIFCVKNSLVSIALLRFKSLMVANKMDANHGNGGSRKDTKTQRFFACVELLNLRQREASVVFGQLVDFQRLRGGGLVLKGAMLADLRLELTAR